MAENHFDSVYWCLWCGSLSLFRCSSAAPWCRRCWITVLLFFFLRYQWVQVISMGWFDYIELFAPAAQKIHTEREIERAGEYRTLYTTHNCARLSMNLLYTRTRKRTKRKKNRFLLFSVQMPKKNFEFMNLQWMCLMRWQKNKKRSAPDRHSPISRGYHTQSYTVTSTHPYKHTHTPE